MAATQRPNAEATLMQASGAPARKDLPAWSICGTADKNSAPGAMRFMSEGADARKVVKVKEASHVRVADKVAVDITKH